MAVPTAREPRPGSAAREARLAAAILLMVCVAATRSQAEPGRLPAEIAIPMRDEKQLAADLYLPRVEGRYPTVLIITPYNRKALRLPLAIAERTGALVDAERYACVVADWRGFYGSRAAATDVPLLQRRVGRDGYDAVEWIARQPWSDGKVGMWGASALGRVQFLTAVEQPPHLVCICPLVMSFTMGYDKYYHGGVFKRGRAESQEDVGWTGVVTMATRHPLYDWFWRLIDSNSLRDMPRVQVPVCLIGGWYDLETEGVIETFLAFREKGSDVARSETRLLIGPWDHMGASGGRLRVGDTEFPEAEGASLQQARLFFDYWLRGQKQNGWDKAAPIRWFEMGSNRWRESATWPPQGLGVRAFYLRADGALSDAPETKPASFHSFVFDPLDPSPTLGGMNLAAPGVGRHALAAGPMDQRRVVESRGDLVACTTDALTRPVRLTGAARANLFVSSDRRDTDIVARLCDVHPDGRSMLVTDGARRMRFRESLERQDFLEPGKVYPVTVTLSVTAHSFEPGHRIRILITSSNYPRFDVNPNNGDHFLADRTKALKATNTVHCDAAHPSALELPVVGE